MGFVSSKSDVPVVTQDVEDPKKKEAEINQRITEAVQQAVKETEARYKALLQAETQKFAQRWAGLESEFGQVIASMEQQIADQLIATSVRLAEVIVRQQLPNKGMIESIIRETLAPISDLQGVQVRMNPADAKEILALREASEVASVTDRIEIVADHSLMPVM